MNLTAELSRIGPLSMVRELPPGPVEQCTTEALTNFVANISLFTRGKEPQEPGETARPDE